MKNTTTQLYKKPLSYYRIIPFMLVGQSLVVSYAIFGHHQKPLYSNKFTLQTQSINIMPINNVGFMYRARVFVCSKVIRFFFYYVFPLDCCRPQKLLRHKHNQSHTTRTRLTISINGQRVDIEFGHAIAQCQYGFAFNFEQCLWSYDQRNEYEKRGKTQSETDTNSAVTSFVHCH